MEEQKGKRLRKRKSNTVTKARVSFVYNGIENKKINMKNEKNRNLTCPNQKKKK